MSSKKKPRILFKIPHIAVVCFLSIDKTYVLAEISDKNANSAELDKEQLVRYVVPQKSLGYLRRS